MTTTWESEQLASVPKWFSDEDVYSEHQTHVHRQESKLSIQVIQNLLDGKIDPKAAASEIAAGCEERIARNGDTMAPEGVWKVFCSAVARFAHEGESCDRLIQLLVELSKIDVVGDNGVPIASSMNSDTFWRQLPGFSLSFRDELTSEAHMTNVIPFRHWPLTCFHRCSLDGDLVRGRESIFRIEETLS